VQGFYDWYLANPTGKLSTPSLELALKSKRMAFTVALYRALKEDFDAQAQVKGDSVGLDFDRFLNSQDACEKYAAGPVTHKSGSYFVEIFGICDGKKNAKPDVVAELTFVSQGWCFANFHYGKSKWSDDENLRAILRNLRKDRQPEKK